VRPLKKFERSVLAFLIAPPLPGSISATILVLWPLHPIAIEDLAGFVALGAMLGLTLGCGAMFVVGVPIHLLLMRLRRTEFLAYSLCGCAAGGLIGWLLNRPFEFFMPSVNAWNTTLYAVTGGMIASIAWAIRRPDRDANPAKPTP
jgi:hypothetical protein